MSALADKDDIVPDIGRLLVLVIGKLRGWKWNFWERRDQSEGLALMAEGDQG